MYINNKMYSNGSCPVDVEYSYLLHYELKYNLKNQFFQNMSLISGQAPRSLRSGVSGSNYAPAGANGKTYAEKKAEALAAKNTAVLSYDELERIKNMCKQTTEEQDYQTMRLNERKEL